MLVSMLSSCGFRVPRPEIKSGEFNYSVTYEYAGEIKTVSGVYECEYTGLYWSLEGGYHRGWSGHIKGGTADDFIVLDKINDGDEVILVLQLNPEYFMGDGYVELYGLPEPSIRIYDYMEDDALRVIHDADEVEEICGAKIISYEYDEPIENSFSIFN